jgi:hypothetical protein
MYYCLRCTNIYHFEQDITYQEYIKYTSLSFLSNYLYCPNRLPTHFPQCEDPSLIVGGHAPQGVFAIFHARVFCMGM